MTDAEREALVERMALAICNTDCADMGFPSYPTDMVRFRDVSGYSQYVNRARAALTAAEPVVRADEREACIVNARTALDRFGAWNGSITPDKLIKPIEKRIRARGDA